MFADGLVNGQAAADLGEVAGHLGAYGEPTGHLGAKAMVSLLDESVSLNQKEVEAAAKTIHKLAFQEKIDFPIFQDFLLRGRIADYDSDY